MNENDWKPISFHLTYDDGGPRWECSRSDKFQFKTSESYGT